MDTNSSSIRTAKSLRPGTSVSRTGVDSQTGLVHSARVMAANVHDSQVPIHASCEAPRFYGDSAYRGQAQRERLKTLAPKTKDFTNKRANRRRWTRRQIDASPACAPRLSIGFLPSSGSGVLPRVVIAACRRMPIEPSPCSRCST